jgi:hypothetical protein
MLAADEKLRRQRRLAMVLMPLMTVVWAGMSMFNAVLLGAWGWVQVAIIAVAVALAIPFYRRSVLRMMPARSSRELGHGLLARRRCPSCLYKFGHAVAEGDGCVVCPECGAAWRLGGDAAT